MKKICTKCKKSKKLENFAVESRRRDGRASRCKLCINEEARLRYKDSPDKKLLIEKRKKYYKDNIETEKQKRRDYYKKTKEKKKLYTQRNKKYINARKNSYVKQRKLKDPAYHTKLKVRRLISMYLERKGFKKTSKTAQILGCSFEKLHTHLKQTFELNYGIPFNHIDAKLLHIDHITPMSESSTEKEVLKLNHYRNLQYLFSWDNLEKGNKLEWSLK